jgi:hypothetical protein
MEYVTLKTGDYSVRGLEDVLCIERKGSVDEIAGNLTTPRFKKELERIVPFKYKYIICEFTLFDILQYPVGSKVPAKNVTGLRMTGGYLLKLLTQLQVKYDIHVIYAGNKLNAFKYAESLIKRIVELENVKEDNNEKSD